MIEVPIARPDLRPLDITEVTQTLKSGWIVQGPQVEQFERSWTEFTGAAHSIAVSSCTSGLLLSLMATGFAAGDEAIVPAFTWTATANVVEQLGGTVVFCDIDGQSFNLDTNMLSDLVSGNTRAIIPVHLFGLPADMHEINEIARTHDAIVIEDAACGFGSSLDKQHVGTFGQTGVFSFHPRKAITTGEGGMITTDSAALAARLASLRNHGAAKSDAERHTSPQPYVLADHTSAGLNQRMTDIQASLGLSQMRRAGEIANERKSLASTYHSQLADLEWLELPITETPYEHGYQSYVCTFQPDTKKKSSLDEIHERRNAWMDRLLRAGVSSRPGTHAVHMLSYYKSKYRCEPDQYPIAWAADRCSIALPLFNGMTEAEQAHVIEVLHTEVP